jgi:hypothetical protein
VLGIVAFARHSPPGAGLACLLVIVVGIYDAIHIHMVVAAVTYYGVQLDQSAGAFTR